MEKLHIVYPYRIPIDKKFGWELKYSIESLKQNLKCDFDITIIGDIPEWINDKEIRCIHLNNHHLKVQRQSKINEKILKACELYKDFVVFNDDIYLMKALTVDELKIPRRKKNIISFNGKEKLHKNSFIKQMMNSYFILKKLGKQYNLNFVSHCPHYYETNKIKEIQKYINLAPQEFPSVVFENIYYNFFGIQGEPAWGFRYGCWGSNCKKYNGEKIINHDEKGSNLNPWIKELLKEKFEKKYTKENR